MDIWNYAKTSASVAWDSVGSSLTTGISWTVVDTLSASFVNPVVFGALPSGMVGNLLAGYYNNMLQLTKLALWKAT